MDISFSELQGLVIDREACFSNSGEMMLAEKMERRKIKCLITCEIFNILVGY